MAAACAPLAGCGSSSRTLDASTIEHAIATSILTQRHVQTNVQCPAGIPRQVGLAFTCTARLDVGGYPVGVVVKDRAGHVRYASQAPLVALNVEKVQSAIAQSILSQRRLRAAVRCPAAVLQQTGLRFRCTATVGGRSYPFEVTEVNGQGQVRYVGL